MRSPEPAGGGGGGASVAAAMAAILREFLDVETDVPPIEEPAALPVRHYHASWEATIGDTGVREEFGKVYIDGIGYMKDGRRLRDGREKADAKRLYRATGH
jgi:hypothetical protein